MSQLFTPRPYQVLMAEHIERLDRCAIWAGMGMGKSCGTLTALNALDLIEGIYPVLVIAPLRVARTTWPAEVRKWTHLRNLAMRPILGHEAQRTLALDADAQIFTINFENLGWLIEYLGDRWPFKTVVVDEATKLKGFRLRQGAKRARALAQAPAPASRC